ncbi:antitoxin [Pseudanabaena minima]|uniref:antitoxin n=1 Tax=Pseudanabaena minima TaxID=890415 RepID=UPI003DA9AA86
MITQYQIRLFRNGHNQALNIPQAFAMSSNNVIIRKEAERLIIEPYKKKSLLDLLLMLRGRNSCDGVSLGLARGRSPYKI